MKKIRRKLTKHILMPLMALAILFTSVCSTSIDAHAAWTLLPNGSYSNFRTKEECNIKVKSNKNKKWKVSVKKVSAKTVFGKDTANLIKWLHICKTKQLFIAKLYKDANNKYVSTEENCLCYRDENGEQRLFSDDSNLLSNEAKAKVIAFYEQDFTTQRKFETRIKKKIFKLNKKGKIVTGEGIEDYMRYEYDGVHYPYADYQKETATFWAYVNKALKTCYDFRDSFDTNMWGDTNLSLCDETYMTTIKKGKTKVFMLRDNLSTTEAKNLQFLFSDKSIAKATKIELSFNPNSGCTDVYIKALKKGNTMMVIKRKNKWGSYLQKAVYIRVI